MNEVKRPAVLRKALPWLAASAIGGGVLLVVLLRGPASPSDAAQAPPRKSVTIAPARNLAIRAAESQAKAEDLLTPEGAAWEKATPTTLILNRTPRIYQTEPIQERRLPKCEVRALRADSRLLLRLQWDDTTRNAPAAPPARTGEAGEPKVLYKRPTGATAAFADAACVMVPENWTGPNFPSLLMGDLHAPAKLYYWNASTGAQVLKASGRATPQPIGQTVAHRAVHTKTCWQLTLDLPDLPAGYPLAFALWDGEYADRDGLKFFSIWYVLLRD
jgi:hypothetical protein